MGISVGSISSGGIDRSKGPDILILVEIYCQVALAIELAKFQISPAVDENTASSHPCRSQYGCQTGRLFFFFAKWRGEKWQCKVALICIFLILVDIEYLFIS